MALGTFGGALTLVSVSDGADGGGYTLSLNPEKIYKFYIQGSDDPVYSPTSLTFGVNTSEGVVVPTSEYTSELTLIAQNSQISNIWSLLGRLQGYPVSEYEQPQAVNMLSVGRTVQTNTIVFNFFELYGYDISKPELGNSSADILAFNTLLTLMSEENCFLTIQVFQSNTPLVKTVVSIEFGTNKDMAKFAVTANTIEAAVSNSKLEFSATGLAIRNGGLSIFDNQDNKIFYYDNVGQSLYVEGTGTFTGTIHATAGSFTGDVSADNLIANAGTIGGFTIHEDGLYSIDDNQSIQLISTPEGSYIKADNIELGVGAKIKRYIQLGNAYLWNPDDQDNISRSFIEVKDSNDQNVISLSDEGVFRLGQITMNGHTSTIYGDSFSITPSLASFSNISASGKISTAIFEQGHLQSAGGLMMFKPAYKIESYTGNVLTLDQEFLGSVDDYVYVVKDDGAPISSLIQVSAKQGNTVTLINTIDGSDFSYSGALISLIDIGAENDLIIGINSSNDSTAFLKQRGITISQFNLAQSDPEDPSTKYMDENINPKVFLGDLDTSGIDFSDSGVQKSRGFGLYSENVYLTGSLTTKINTTSANPSFAGVNTLDGTHATVFIEHAYGDLDDSAIVFWAGSTGVTPQEIQRAPFQVTERGSIYATQGIFTGAIITESFISGADLYAARIHGTGRTEGTDYGLAFYDTSEGIVFFEGTPSTASEVFSIGNTGFRKGNSYFIDIDSSGINFNGNDFRGTNYYTNNTQGEYLRLYQNFVAGAHISSEDVEILDAKITFNQQGLYFNVTNAQNMSITQNLVKMSAESTQMDNTVLFGEQLKYEKVSNGYDLFVMS